MPEIPKKFIKRAAENVISFGDTDVFPFPFENILIRRDRDGFISVIEELAENFETSMVSNPPQFESTLVPAGYQGYRWATQICPFWNAYLLAAVLRHGDEIEAARVPTALHHVHSYRVDGNLKNPAIFQSDYNWRSFMLRSHDAAQRSNYVVVTDVSEFYRRIYHHRIENSLEQVSASNLPDKIVELLKQFSGGSSYGLPIGGPAARIMSEVVINQIDHLLMAKGIEFCRFSDDFHIFTSTEEEAYKAIQQLSELLILNQGLTLQKSKTRILPASEFLSTFPNHLLPGAQPQTDRERLFSLSLNFDPYAPTADEDYEELKASLGNIDFLALLDEELSKSQIHNPTVSKLIKGLKVTTGRIRTSAIKTILDSIGILYPVFTQLLIVLNSIKEELRDAEFVLICEQLLHLSESGSYIMSLDIHRCFAVRILQSFPGYRVDALFDNWYQHGSPILRRDIIAAYIARNAWLQLSDLKHRIAGASPWERRAFIAGSYVLGDEGKHWRNAQTFNSFETFVRDGASKLSDTKELGKLV